MSNEFRDHVIEDLAPPWLLQPEGEAWLTAFADAKDAIVERLKLGVKLRFPLVADPSALAALGADAVIERGAAESDASYAGRLAAAHEIWGWSGTKRGLLAAFTSSGFTNADTVCNREWGAGPPDGELSKWARFHVVLADVPWTQRVWDDGWTWGDEDTTETFDSTATVAEVEHVQRLIATWAPTHAICVAIIIAFGSSSEVTGYTLITPECPEFTVADAAATIWWAGE